jgi:hypothetical protein
LVTNRHIGWHLKILFWYDSLNAFKAIGLVQAWLDHVSTIFIDLPISFKSMRGSLRVYTWGKVEESQRSQSPRANEGVRGEVREGWGPWGALICLQKRC